MSTEHPAEGRWARDVLVDPKVVDLDPTGCPYTWRAAGDTPLNRRYDGVRCTRAIHTGDDHHWDSREQEERSDRVRATLVEAMRADPRLAEQRGTKPLTPITVAEAHEDAIAAFRAAMDAPVIKSREDILEEKLEAIATRADEAGYDEDAAAIRDALAQLQGYWAQA